MADDTIWVWEGLDRKGARSRGEIPAASETLAKAALRKQGVNPLKLKKKPKPLFGPKKIVPKDIAVFMRQISTMMNAGVPLVQAMEIIGRGHEKPLMRDMLLKIKADVESGTAFSVALSQFPRFFDELVINLIEAGEQSGELDNLLNKIATYKEKTESIKAKIKKALFYPVAVIVVAFIVTAILLIFVVPTFRDVFQSFGADLPAFTLMVIALSEFVQAWWWAILFGLAGIGWGFKEAHFRSAKFRRWLDITLLKVPVIGELLTKASIARFCRTLSVMFAAGVPLVDALKSVSGSTGNALYAEATLRMRDETSTGMQLNTSMRGTGVFPNMVVQMAAIGEESGELDEMMGKVADFYEEEVDNMVDAMSSLLEPFILVILGTLVGGLVVAMYLPIFKLGSVI